NGKLIRKTLDEQRALLLTVFDESRVPPGRVASWIPRWNPPRDDSNWSRSEQTGSWRCVTSSQAVSPSDVLTYRHSLRSGGDHITTVGLSEPLTSAQRKAFEPSDELFPLSPEPPFPGVYFVEATNSLACRGVLTDRVYHQLIAVDQTDSLTAAIERLRTESRNAPVKDFEAYNEHSPVLPENEITEFCLSFVGQFDSSAGKFAVTLAVRGERFTCRFDAQQRVVTLEEESTGKILRSGELSLEHDRDEFLVEFSTIDRQVCLAIDGRSAFEPWRLSESSSDFRFPAEIAALGDVRGTLDVRDLKLSRDVYYTSRNARHGVGEVCRLGAGEYFMLGDNSPVSSDSRMWEQPAVPAKFLVGKPFAVHLPSRTLKMGSSDSAWQIRLPDFSRVRFVR
ncbi:MAG TPA: S26 family signal peptidase, partial [Planctomycetaceae bacterium]|nr:S26 family signal peptidase [Planctomycetaceae bacterium]